MECRKIVVAPDSFKGSLSSAEVAEAIGEGILNVFPTCEVLKLSVADGGEGTVEALIDTLAGESVEVEVHDPLMRPLKAAYGLVRQKAGQQTAVLEMSAASGLPLLAPEERNPWLTNTYGTGELIMDALRRGCRDFLVGIGGSATNDAGTGMLAALGFRFLDAAGEPVVPCGGTLGQIVSVDVSAVPAAVMESRFTVACDVDTPFCGTAGAAEVFARQKGADEAMVRKLDEGMAAFAEVIDGWWKKRLVEALVRKDEDCSFRQIPGTGAAGGLGGGFLAFLNARLVKGVDMVLDAVGFDEQLQGADLVITGEGKLDFQTSKGKTPYGVMLRAAARHIPTIALGGCVELPQQPVEGPAFAAAFPVVSGPVALEEAMKPEVAACNVRNTVVRIMNLIKNLM